MATPVWLALLLAAAAVASPQQHATAVSGPGLPRTHKFHPRCPLGTIGSLAPQDTLLSLRGGAERSGLGGGSGGATKKKRRRAAGETAAAVASQSSGGKRKRKRKKSTAEGGQPTVEDMEEGRAAINTAIKTKDAAEAIGDAIRDRADILRSDPIPPPIHRVDASITSLGLALGTSDSTSRRQLADGDDVTTSPDEDEGGGVQASPSAVLANYFLKSHGGAHGVQCLLSFLSVLAGLGAMLLPPPTVASSTPLGTEGASTGGVGYAKLILLRRTLLCALAKHASGLIAATAMSASRISQVGLRNTRRRIEMLALDPVAQYLFYCALLLIWTPVVGPGVGKDAGGDATAAVAAVPWWLVGRKRSSYSTLCILGPILLREVVSTAWVVSDVFVILASSSEGGREPTLLKMARGTVDAAMSLLFTPTKWRGSDSAARQKLLAKLVSKASLGLEILTGLIIMYDAIRAFSDFALSPVGSRPKLSSVAKKIACARLYVNFMLVRRKKIRDLVGNIRGGASQIPGRVLDVLLEPRKAMGLEGDELSISGDQKAGNERRWMDYAAMAFDV